MFTANGPTTRTTKPTPPSPGLPGYFQTGDEVTGEVSTIVTAAFLNTIQEEVANVVRAAGIVLDHLQDDQLLRAIQILCPAETSVLVTSSQTLPPASGIIVVNAASAPITLTLPTVAGAGGRPIQLMIFRSDNSGNTVTIQRSGADTIRGNGTINLPVGSDVVLKGDGASTFWLRRDGRIIGEVIAFTGNGLPPGCIWADGSNISRTTYATYFAVVGTQYGAGNGATTFGVPDMRGRALVGRDNMGGIAANRITASVSGIAGTVLGAAGGSEHLHAHGHAVAETPHTHGINIAAAGAHTPTASTSTTGSHRHNTWTAGAGDHTHPASVSTVAAHTHPTSVSPAGAHAHTGSTGGGGAHQHKVAPFRLSDNTGPRVREDGAEISAVGGGQEVYTDIVGDHVHAFSTTAVGDHIHTVNIGAAGDHTHTASITGVGVHAHDVGMDLAGDHTHVVTVAPIADHIHGASASSATTGVTVAANGYGAAQNVQPSIVINHAIYVGI